MIEGNDARDLIPLQDVDLLNRLSHYFDSIEQQLEAGHGWFIFNAEGARGSRIGQYVLRRLAGSGPLLSYYVVPWRDFSLNAYMVEIELQAFGEQKEELHGKAKSEFEIASRVSRDSMVRMVASDLLIITGLRPSHRHELMFLDQTVERRYHQRLSTILTTPYLPHQLASEYSSLVPEVPLWDRLFSRMYERSLMAV